MMLRRSVLLISLLAASAWAKDPQVDLRVELRQVEEGSAGYVVSTRPSSPMLAPQQLQVRNGSEARFTLGQTVPVQWVQSAASFESNLSVGGAQVSSKGGAVSQGLTWMDASQTLSVKPRWPGGQKPAVVEVSVQAGTVETRAATGITTGQELPAQGRTQLMTTVGAPIGQWVTIAVTGQSAPKGVYSSEAVADSRRLIQIRVIAP